MLYFVAFSFYKKPLRDDVWDCVSMSVRLVQDGGGRGAVFR